MLPEPPTWLEPVTVGARCHAPGNPKSLNRPCICTGDIAVLRHCLCTGVGHGSMSNVCICTTYLSTYTLFYTRPASVRLCVPLCMTTTCSSLVDNLKHVMPIQPAKPTCLSFQLVFSCVDTER